MVPALTMLNISSPIFGDQDSQISAISSFIGRQIYRSGYLEEILCSVCHLIAIQADVSARGREGISNMSCRCAHESEGDDRIGAKSLGLVHLPQPSLLR